MLAARDHRHLVSEGMHSASDEDARFAALCASLVHEISQPMAAIAANAAACRNWLAVERPDHARIATIVDRISASAASVSGIIDALRALLTRQEGARRPAQINDSIGEVRIQLADEIARHGADIVLDLDPAIPPIAFEAVQIRQLLANLIRNGAEAMAGLPGQRRLLIRSSRYREGVKIDVIDQGTKRPDAGRMFDPFYTTKPKGMGIGLALCRLIADAHGGHLWTEPAEPCGTCMSFILPGQRPQAASACNDQG